MLKARIETVLAVVAAALAVVTFIWPDWIETVFSVDPDGGNGTAEWLVVGLLALVAVTAAMLARRDYRRTRGLTAEGS
jgi:hypothetical protein